MRPATPSGQSHCPVLTLQEGESEKREHSHGEQPSEVRLKVSGRQSPQVGPPTPGRQLHWPDSGPDWMQMGDREPTGSQSQAVGERERERES